MAGGVDRVDSHTNGDNPNRVAGFAGGSMVHEQIVFFAYAAPNGTCDNMSCAKVVTIVAKKNKLQVVVRSLKGGSKRTLTDALRHFISVDNERALVTMVDLAMHMEAT